MLFRSFLDTYDRFDGGREYLFFTKPDLNIYAELYIDKNEINLQKAGEFDPNLRTVLVLCSVSVLKRLFCISFYILKYFC